MNIFFKYSMDYQVVKLFILDKFSNEFFDKLYYYGVYYILDVLEVIFEFCCVLGISVYEMIFFKIVVFFYDFGFIISSDNYEELGCNIVCQYLLGFGYFEQEIEWICGMIIVICIL